MRAKKLAPIDIADIQRILKKIGYYHGDWDGVLNRSTAIALREFATDLVADTQSNDRAETVPVPDNDLPPNGEGKINRL